LPIFVIHGGQAAQFLTRGLMLRTAHPAGAVPRIIGESGEDAPIRKETRARAVATVLGAVFLETTNSFSEPLVAAKCLIPHRAS